MLLGKPSNLAHHVAVPLCGCLEVLIVAHLTVVVQGDGLVARVVVEAPGFTVTRKHYDGALESSSCRVAFQISQPCAGFFDSGQIDFKGIKGLSSSPGGIAVPQGSVFLTVLLHESHDELPDLPSIVALVSGGYVPEAVCQS